MGDGRIGAVAPMSDRPAQGAGKAARAAAARDRLTVDLRGRKPALLARARALGVSPSDVVRDALGAALRSDGPAQLGGQSGEQTDGQEAPLAEAVARQARVRVSLRLTSVEARRLRDAAYRSGLPLGVYIAGLAAGIPAVAGTRHADHLAAATATCAELATLSRNLRHLDQLLREGSLRAAQEYRAMLGTLDADVRRHLAVASDALAALRPTRAHDLVDQRSIRRRPRRTP
jgi:hypothetical protein